MRLIERIQSIEQGGFKGYKYYTLMQKGNRDNVTALCYFPDRNELKDAYEYEFRKIMPQESIERKLAFESYRPLSRILSDLIKNNELQRIISVIPNLNINEIGMKGISAMGRTIHLAGTKVHNFLKGHFLETIAKYAEKRKFPFDQILLVQNNEIAQEHILDQGNTIIATYTSKGLNGDIALFGPGN